MQITLCSFPFLSSMPRPCLKASVQLNSNSAPVFFQSLLLDRGDLSEHHASTQEADRRMAEAMQKSVASLADALDKPQPVLPPAITQQTAAASNVDILTGRVRYPPLRYLLIEQFTSLQARLWPFSIFGTKFGCNACKAVWIMLLLHWVPFLHSLASTT